MIAKVNFIGVRLRARSQREAITAEGLPYREGLALKADSSAVIDFPCGYPGALFDRRELLREFGDGTRSTYFS